MTKPIDLPTVVRQPSPEPVPVPQDSVLKDLAANPATLKLVSDMVGTWCEIEKIKASADAEVARIEAKTKDIQAKFAGLVDIMKAHGEHIHDVKDAIVKILHMIPEHDDKSRLVLMENLPHMVEGLLKTRLRGPNAE